jgi:hypothetical protein
MCLRTYSIQASAQLEIESKEKYVRKLVKNEKDAIAERDAALKQLSSMEEFEQRAKRAEESLKALNDHLRVEKEKYESFVEESSKVGVAEVNNIKIMTSNFVDYYSHRSFLIRKLLFVICSCLDFSRVGQIQNRERGPQNSSASFGRRHISN